MLPCIRECYRTVSNHRIRSLVKSEEISKTLVFLLYSDEESEARKNMVAWPRPCRVS